jgi:prophage maintenance system killer protein
LPSGSYETNGYRLTLDAPSRRAILHRIDNGQSHALMAEGASKLESAIAAPEWAGLRAGADLAEQAALLTVRIAQAHALVDNNKRLAYMVGVIFLRENGRPLPAEHSIV